MNNIIFIAVGFLCGLGYAATLPDGVEHHKAAEAVKVAYNIGRVSVVEELLDCDTAACPVRMGIY